MNDRHVVRVLGIVAFLIIAAACFASPALAGGDANFFLGTKQMDKTDWKDTIGADQNWSQFGAEVTWGPEKWPIWFATDVLVAVDVESDFLGISGNDGTFLTEEIALGVRKIWKAGKARPYIGGGLDVITGAIDLDVPNTSESDVTLGAWAGAGIFWRLGSRFNIGGSVRWSDGQVTIGGEDLQVGGLQYGLLLGWGWPGGK